MSYYLSSNIEVDIHFLFNNGSTYLIIDIIEGYFINISIMHD